ncbi:MAG: DUF4430 domain-containing protein [Clostridia bacterium]|nr:DUF4430 domain-containing protein [Clostridia bacterium]
MKKVILFLLIISISTLMGCSKKYDLEDGSVNFIISRDFGAEELDNKTIEISEDLSVIEVLEGNFDVKTAYGGGFINSINGLKSGFTGMKDKKKVDWFYYVNGMLAHVGAGEYYLKPDDIVIWDYHDWSSSSYISSIIGAYPRNFINGYEEDNLKTEIIYSKDYGDEGNKLLDYLKERGLKAIEIEGLNGEELENGQVNSIVIGTWDDISGLSYIKDIYEAGKRSGLFFRFDKELQVLNYMGDGSKEYERGAVITSITKEYGSKGTLWLITGNDERDIERAIKLLYEEPEKIKGKFSVIVRDGEVMNVPHN